MQLNKFFRRVAVINESGGVTRTRKLLARLTKSGVDAVEYPLIGVDTLIAPPQFLSTPNELAGLYTFQSIIRKAYSDNLQNILIFSEKVKLIRDFDLYFDRIENELPSHWDLLYLGYNESLDKVPRHQLENADNTILREAYWATGVFALGINWRFFNYFLEETRNPLYDLDSYIAKMKLNVFVTEPKLVNKLEL